ncbi:MAG: hypothetical protein KJZ68_07785 [Phycisphaerales bacterium]|nr:hypothetical protein [Phycisphaerales bacterium]
MSDYNPYQQPTQHQYAPGMGGAPVMPPRVSGLAIGSLICSLIFCCPATTVIGPLLGLMAFLSISARPMERRGKGLAVAGILIGVLATTGQVMLTLWMINEAEKTDQYLRNAPGTMLTAGYAGDVTTFRADAAGSLAAVTDDEIKTFFEELRTRYGDFVSATYDEEAYFNSITGVQDLINPVQQHPFKLRFSGGEVTAEFGIAKSDPRTGRMYWGMVRVVNITIRDPDRGDITLP